MHVTDIFYISSLTDDTDKTPRPIIKHGGRRVDINVLLGRNTITYQIAIYCPCNYQYIAGNSPITVRYQLVSHRFEHGGLIGILGSSKANSQNIQKYFEIVLSVAVCSQW